MTAFVEYPESVTYQIHRGESPTEVDWNEDNIRAWQIHTYKEYEFFAAICGERNASDIDCLVKARGWPERISLEAKRYESDYGTTPGLCGWLNPSEVHACLKHMQTPSKHLGFEVHTAIHLLDHLASQLGDKNVRLLFSLET